MLEKMEEMKKEVKENKSKKRKKAPIGLIAALILCCVGFYAIYRLLFELIAPEAVLTVYMVLSAVCILFYVLYNRGFSRRGVTIEMLPDSWSDEKKTEFIEDAKKRLQRTKPLLVVIIGFVFTFLVEAIELFVLPLILEFVGK